ncbi:MAG: hypothetical protein GX345_09090 [Clostridiales bacterium]|nr:hypothetical protein [Clostridiales bacterium]
MKKRDKETKKTIRDKMQSFDEQVALPEELGSRAIVEQLDSKDVKTKKKSYKGAVRRIAAAAAALVVLVGAFSFYHFFQGRVTIEFDHEAGLASASSNEEIISIFKQMKTEARLERYRNFSFGDILGMKSKSDAALPESFDEVKGEMVGDNAGGSEKSDYGETNVQVKGVDEPDVLKNDGKYLYIVATTGESVGIYDALPADKMKKITTITKENSRFYSINSIFVSGELLVVLGEGTQIVEGEETENEMSESRPYGSGIYSYGRRVSFCDIYDLGDISKPKLVKSLEQDGNLITARRVGDEIYVLSSYNVDVFSDNLEEDCLPRFKHNGEEEVIGVKDINITEKPDPGYLIASGTRLDDLTAEPNKKAVLGGGHEAYCTADSLFAARTVYEKVKDSENEGALPDIWREPSNYKTEIYSFDIGGGKITFKNSGLVDGEILNQFSMDKHEGYFRLATTSGSWERSSNNVFVLNEKLETVGAVKNIAPGERIFAVRFMGDTAYMVTFEQTDPFFVLDLKDPKNPKLLGELKIPGFSSYLHPVGDGLVLGIGQNGDDRGTLPGVKLSLFDVNDPTAPKEIDKLIIKGQTETAAMHNHRAFLTLPADKGFAIPIVRYDKRDFGFDRESSGGDESISSSYSGDGYYFSSFESFEIKDNLILPLVSYREVNKDNYTYGYGGIYRGTYIGENMYTASALALTAYNMADGKVLSTIETEYAATYREYDVGYDEYVNE